MARGCCTFKQSDVTKAVRAVVAAGVHVARVEVDKDGRIVVVALKPPEAPREGSSEHNEWDDVA
jgi:hypothetical protein